MSALFKTDYIIPPDTKRTFTAFVLDDKGEIKRYPNASIVYEGVATDCEPFGEHPYYPVQYLYMRRLIDENDYQVVKIIHSLTAIFFDQVDETVIVVNIPEEKQNDDEYIEQLRERILKLYVETSGSE